MYAPSGQGVLQRLQSSLNVSYEPLLENSFLFYFMQSSKLVHIRLLLKSEKITLRKYVDVLCKTILHVISLNFRVMTGDLDDQIAYVSVCIFWHEQGNFGRSGYGK